MFRRLLDLIKGALSDPNPRAERPPLYLEGKLMRDERGFVILQMDGGGYWSIDLPWKHRRLMGRRVRVVATRIGFNDLSLISLDPMETPD